jgi:hypothetical protein
MALACDEGSSLCDPAADTFEGSFSPDRESRDDTKQHQHPIRKPTESKTEVETKPNQTNQTNYISPRDTCCHLILSRDPRLPDEHLHSVRLRLDLVARRIAMWTALVHAELSLQQLLSQPRSARQQMNGAKKRTNELEKNK